MLSVRRSSSGRAACPQLSRRAWDDGEPCLGQPAHDDLPVAGEAMSVHGMSAEDRLAVMAAHDFRSAWSPVEGPPDRADARGPNKERPVRLHLAFLRVFGSGMIHGVKGGLIIESAKNARPRPSDSRKKTANAARGAADGQDGVLCHFLERVGQRQRVLENSITDRAAPNPRIHAPGNVWIRSNFRQS
jgi:hypothetical protein